MIRTREKTKTNRSLNSDWPWRIEAEFRWAIDETDGTEEALAEFWEVHPRTVRRWAARHDLQEAVYGDP